MSVLHSVTLIDNHILPLSFAKKRFVLHDVVECCDKDIELASSEKNQLDHTTCVATYISHWNVEHLLDALLITFSDLWISLVVYK